MSVEENLSKIKLNKVDSKQSILDQLENSNLGTKKPIRTSKQGRPATGKSPSIQIQVPNDLRADFQKYCDKNGLSFSSGCRMAMMRLLEQERSR